MFYTDSLIAGMFIGVTQNTEYQEAKETECPVCKKAKHRKSPYPIEKIVYLKNGMNVVLLSDGTYAQQHFEEGYCIEINQEEALRLHQGVMIKKKRVERNISQPSLAKSLGVSQPRIAEYESGKRLPRFDVLCRMAAILDMPVKELRI